MGYLSYSIYLYLKPQKVDLCLLRTIELFLNKNKKNEKNIGKTLLTKTNAKRVHDMQFQKLLTIITLLVIFVLIWFSRFGIKKIKEKDGMEIWHGCSKVLI